MKTKAEHLAILKELEACQEGIDWYIANGKDTLLETLELAKDKETIKYFNYYVSKILDSDNKIKYAIYAAEKVLYLFEEKYPKDKRPRAAIDAAKDYLNDKSNAYAAACAAYAADAADAADAAYTAADAAYDTACAAACAAYAAAYDTADADAAAACAAYAADAACANSKGAYMTTFKDIVTYGLGLLKEQGIE